MVAFPLYVVDVFDQVLFVEMFSQHLRCLAIVVACRQQLRDALAFTDEELETRQLTLHSSQVSYIQEQAQAQVQGQDCRYRYRYRTYRYRYMTGTGTGTGT